MYRALLLLSMSASAADWSFEFDARTLAATAHHRDGRSVIISSPQSIAEPGFNIIEERVDNGLRLRFRPAAAAEVTWPSLAPATAEAAILPIGEGFYVPFAKPRWRQFLIDRSPLHTMEELSMPAWGLRHRGFTVVYLLEEPFHNELRWSAYGSELHMQLVHRFARNQPQKEFSILVQMAGDSPVETARIFRTWFQKQKRFVTLSEKIETTPNAEKLIGAAHVYLWAEARLTESDVINWRGLFQAMRGSPPPSYVPAPVKRELLAAIMPHQERTLQAFLRPAAERGSAISPRMMQLLHSAGLDRLWLGAPGKEVEVAMQSPETLRQASEYGYLFAPYDSYHSIHSPDEKETWPTAQFDRALYQKGGIVNQNGTMSRGFQGKGYHLSSAAVAPYVAKRVEPVLGRAAFNSWFVDCDATGELFDNYSSAFPQTQEQDMQQRLTRLAWLARDKQLVVGSEGGAWFATPVIHFAHGMLTPLFGWKDPLLRDPKSKYFLGRYWPPESPGMFFAETELPEKYRAIYFDPAYRLPLFQIAFHDSVIATNHWTLPTNKFTNVRRTRELLELLYGVPPLYHLNRAALSQRLPDIKRHYDEFTQLHRQIALLPMTDFKWLNEARTLQTTVFGDRISVTVDFAKGTVLQHTELQP